MKSKIYLMKLMIKNLKTALCRPKIMNFLLVK